PGPTACAAAGGRVRAVRHTQPPRPATRARGPRPRRAAAPGAAARAAGARSSRRLPLELLREGVEAAPQARVDRAARQAGELGDLARGVVEQVAEHDDGAVVAREARERGDHLV